MYFVILYLRLHAYLQRTLLFEACRKMLCPPPDGFDSWLDLKSSHCCLLLWGANTSWGLGLYSITSPPLLKLYPKCTRSESTCNNPSYFVKRMIVCTVASTNLVQQIRVKQHCTARYLAFRKASSTEVFEYEISILLQWARKRKGPTWLLITVAWSFTSTFLSIPFSIWDVIQFGKSQILTNT